MDSISNSQFTRSGRISVIGDTLDGGNSLIIPRRMSKNDVKRYRKRRTAAVPHAATSLNPPDLTSAKGITRFSTTHPLDSAIMIILSVVIDLRIEGEVGTTRVGVPVD